MTKLNSSTLSGPWRITMGQSSPNRTSVDGAPPSRGPTSNPNNSEPRARPAFRASSAVSAGGAPGELAEVDVMALPVSPSNLKVTG